MAPGTESTDNVQERRDDVDVLRSEQAQRHAAYVENTLKQQAEALTDGTNADPGAVEAALGALAMGEKAAPPVKEAKPSDFVVERDASIQRIGGALTTLMSVEGVATARQWSLLIYAWAESKGWNDKARTTRTEGGWAILAVSELAEALEELRNGYGVTDRMHRVEAGAAEGTLAKPEGFDIELADCVIRILHWFSFNSRNPEDTLSECLSLEYGERALAEYGAEAVPLIEALYGTYLTTHEDWLATMAHHIMRAWAHNEPGLQAREYAMSLLTILAWMHTNGVNADDVVGEKMEYNFGRPYLHGRTE